MSFTETQIQFQNRSIMIPSPHPPFLNPFPYTLTLDFGIGCHPTATFQQIGDNSFQSEPYLIGGGAIVLPITSEFIKGSINFKGVIAVSQGNQTREMSNLNGIVSLTLSNLGTEASLTGNLNGFYFPDNTPKKAVLSGKGQLSIEYNTRIISFVNDSLTLTFIR
jgi:hypothetical protein